MNGFCSLLEKHHQVIRQLFAPVDALVQDARSPPSVLIFQPVGEPALSLAPLVGPRGKVLAWTPF
jgi:hypothetical protein